MSAPVNLAASPLFELDGLSFSAGGRSLLAPLTMTLPAGRVIGLIGHNGSGKSTLLKLLARQQAPASGSIWFEGRALSLWEPRAFARRVGYLPQQPPPTTGLTVRELVALGRYPWHGAFRRFSTRDRAKVAEALALTGIDALADRAVDTLSGGERQRVWVALLVAQDAGCLLLDEPTSALDIAHQVEVLALVRGLAVDRRLGVVVVLHDVNMAARFCDEIIALRAGELIARGTPAEIMMPVSLEAIYGIAMEVIPHPSRAMHVTFPR